MTKIWGGRVGKQERRHRPGKVANDPRKEGRAQCKEAKRKAENELQEEVQASRMRQHWRSRRGAHSRSKFIGCSECGWRSQHEKPRAINSIETSIRQRARARRSTTGSSCLAGDPLQPRPLVHGNLDHGAAGGQGN